MDTGIVIPVTASELTTKVATSEVPLLVDVYSDTCAPCALQGPILESFTRINDGRVNVVKLSADDYADMVRTLGVNSVPTLILYDKGLERKRLVGLHALDDLQQELLPHLS